jgi:ATP-dependent DNA helicase RecQ
VPTPLELLRQYWGYDQFRPLQQDIIESVLAGQDTLALMPTGGGKSICFQVPALAREGLCLVVSPLIALMKDQVEALRRRGIRAAAVFSGMHRSEIDVTLDNCIYGDVKVLYVSPERLRTELLQVRVRQMKINLLAVDEAHCVSAWGYDFRPPYLQISTFREEFLPGIPLLALTATATREVRADMLDKLGMRRARVFQQSFARANLSYSVFAVEDKERKLQQVLQNVPGSAVVYTRSRKRTQLVATELHRRGISATFYHAGLTNAERFARQEAWLKGQTRVMVATNAFGMGIDKPDVRAVVHLDLPDSLEAYYQEAGRAGRDGARAYAVALYHPADLSELVRQVEQGYPAISTVRRVYQFLANQYRLAVGSGEGAAYEFDLAEFQGTFGLSTNEAFYSIRLLEREGFVQLSEGYHQPAKLHLLVDNRALYEFQVKNPRFDAFTKLLLRVYGGELFNQFVPISEATLAKHFLVPIPEIQTLLQQLAYLQLAEYVPQRSKPTLTFLTPRYDAHQLPLSVAEIEGRKQRDLDKVRAVAQYAQQPRRCRTQSLLAYFDEHTEQECGICDACLARKKEKTADPAGASGQRQEILTALRAGTRTVQSLVAELAPRNENALLLTLRELIADELVRYDAVGNLRLAENGWG